MKQARRRCGEVVARSPSSTRAEFMFNASHLLHRPRSTPITTPEPASPGEPVWLRVAVDRHTAIHAWVGCVLMNRVCFEGASGIVVG